MINYLDFLGAASGLIATCLFIRVHWLAWPIGLIAICIDLVLFYQKGIYGDMCLQMFYLSITFYGWYLWRPSIVSSTTSAIKTLNSRQMFCLGILSTIMILLIAQILKQFTDSNVPYLDSTTTSLSLVAQYLMCKKIIQTWVLWFIIDALYIGLYAYKGLPFHSGLLLLYLFLAVLGYRQWNKKMDLIKFSSSVSFPPEQFLKGR